jgi:eukaryotic-like serine/threonine-protein kinase
VLSLLWHRARLRLRGLGWTPRDSTRISARDLERLEIHRAVALGLSFVDNIRGAGFQARGLRLALRLGERTHVARAILLEAGYRATQGAKFREGINPLLSEGARIGDELGDAYLRAWSIGVTGVCDYLSGRFREANTLLSQAELIWVGLPGAAWELNHLRFLWLLALRRMGRFRELSVLYDKYRRDASLRGDRLAETTFARAINQVWLARDQPDRGRAELERSSWTSETGFLHLQNWYEIESRAELDMYDGTIARTRDELRPVLATVGKSLLMRIQIVRTSFWFLCGRLILAESAKPHAEAELNRMARRLERERVPYAVVWGKLLRAGQLHQRGDQARAIEVLRETVQLSEEHELMLCAAAARWRLGELLANDEGKALHDKAAEWLASEDIRGPQRMVAVMAPGFNR